MCSIKIKFYYFFLTIFRWVILKQLVRLKLEILLKMTHHIVESKSVKFHLLFPPLHLWQNGIKFMKGLTKPICYKLSHRLTHRHKVAVILSRIWICFIYGGQGACCCFFSIARNVWSDFYLKCLLIYCAILLISCEYLLFDFI